MRGICRRCRSKYGGPGSDICPAGPPPRLRSDAGLTRRLRLPQLADAGCKQNTIQILSNARQCGIYRRRRVTDPWGAVCRENNVRSALSECRAAYPCRLVYLFPVTNGEPTGRFFANRPNLSLGSSSRISRRKQSFSVSRPRLRPSGKHPWSVTASLLPTRRAHASRHEFR